MPAGDNGELGKTQGSPPMRRTGKQGEARRQRLGKRRKKATKARIRAGGTAQAMGKETEQGATRRGRARQAERRAGDGRKTGRRARHKVEAQAARGESRRRGKAQGPDRRRKRSEMQEEAGIRRAAGREAAAFPAPPCRNQRHAPAAPRATGVSASGQKTPARKPAFACGNRAGRIGTSPLAVFQRLREDTGSESAAGRLPARRITPAAPSSPLPSACAASEKERPRPSDSSAA